MTARLVRCRVKGCPWLGPEGHRCPMHTDEAGTAWDNQHLLRLTDKPQAWTRRRT